MSATNKPEPQNLGDAYVIMKRGYYYRPKAQGYTSVLAEAGRFTLAEAKAQSNHEPPRVTYRRLSEAHELSAGAPLEVQLDHAHSKIARLKAALDEIDKLTQYSSGNPEAQLFAVQQIVRDLRNAAKAVKGE